MNHQNLPNVPLTTSTPYNGYTKKSFTKHDHPKPLSSSYMTTPIEPINKKRKTTEVQKSLYEDAMMRQLEEDYENVLEYKMGKFDNNSKPDHYKQKQTHVEVYATHHQGSLPNENETMYKNLNRYTLDERNTYGQEVYFEKDQNPRKMSQQPYLNPSEPEPFRFIRQTDTLEDLDQHESNQQSPQYSRKNSANNLRALNEIMLAKKNSGYGEKNMRNNQQRIYQMDEVEKKAILQHFRVSDLHFLNDQQLLPQNMLAQRLQQRNKSIKLSANNSGKTQSNHAIFRDTIQYVDTTKFNEGFHQYNNRNSQSHHQISDHSSMSSSPLTNVGEGYKGKYRRYKEKYLNMVEVVKQFETLNQTLIKDQRQHFRYYEDTIKHLEGLLLMKDKEIEELTQLLNLSRVAGVRTSRDFCSIQGRQLQIENQKLRKQVESMGHQIQSLKQSLKALDETYQNHEKSKQTHSKHSQKKTQLLKKENQSLMKKIKPLEDLIKTYEQKMKDKEERVNKLSEMNSQLQEEIIKLKNKLRLQETYDTQRDYRISFAPKISKDQFIQQNKSKNDNPTNRTSLQNSLVDPKAHTEIQKYLACIDNQLQLIRSHMTSKHNNQGEKMFQNKKKQLSNVLNSVDQFQGEDSNQQEPQDNPSLNDLINVVDRLASFRVSMGV